MNTILKIFLVSILFCTAAHAKNEYLNTYQINVLSEAKICFASATSLFKEMNEIENKYYAPLILTDEVFDEDNRDVENDPFKGTNIEGKD